MGYFDPNSTLDAVKYYNDNIIDSVNKLSNEYIDNIFKKSNYNVKLSDNLLPKIEKSNKQIKINESKWFRKDWVRIVPIALIVFSSLILILISVLFATKLITTEITLFASILSVASIFIIGCTALLIVISINTKKSNKLIAPIIEQNKKNITIMENELTKITRLISTRDCYDIYEKSFNSFKLNSSFSDDDYANFHLKTSENDNQSVYTLLSGNIFTHPFIYLTTKNMEMVMQTYIGSTIVSYYDDDHHLSTTVVTASIKKPKPTYVLNSKIGYKINVYPNLIFNYVGSFKNQHEVKRFYNHHKDYSQMENNEFDILFPCERNSELEFHTIFSIYTQEQIVNTIKEYKLTNISFYKEKDMIYSSCFNLITNTKFSFYGNYFKTYSPELLKSNFINALNNNLFGLYQYMSLIFSCSLFQMEKYSQPSIKTTKNLALIALIERLINNNGTFVNYLHKKTSDIVNDGIPSIKILESTKNYTICQIDINSFYHTNEIEYVSVYSGIASKMVSVPVKWQKYHPITNSFVGLFWKNKNNNDFFNESLTNAENKYNIKGVYKLINDVLVVFNQDINIKQISGQESSIINFVENSLMKLK